MINAIRIRISRFFIIMLALSIVIFSPTSVFAKKIDEAELFFKGQNNIIFYNSSESDNLCTSSGDCYIVGETRDEKLWSALRHVGFTPEQTAGIIGNIAHEGESPTRQENAYITARDQNCRTAEGKAYDIYTDVTNGAHHSVCMEKIYSGYQAGNGVSGIGLGFVQWTPHDRRLGYLEKMQELGLLKYFEDDAYKTYGSYTDDQLHQAIIDENGSDSDYWALWCAAIKFIWTEMNGEYQGFFNNSTVQEYAAWTASHYEKCRGCFEGMSGYESRIASAEEYYELYQAGEFDSIENGNTTSNTNSYASTGKNVIIIGDSITEDSLSALSEKLPDAIIVAKSTKHFATDDADNLSGLSILQEQSANNSLRNIIVYALGSYDDISSSDIRSIIDIIGPNRKVLFLTNYDVVNDTKYDNNNKAFTAAAATYDNVKLVDWKNAILTATGSPSDYIKDEADANGYAIRPTTLGAELFTNTILEAINDLKPSNTCAKVSNNITTEKEALEFVQQFVRDTNELYGKSYPMVGSIGFDILTNTPADDSYVSPVSSVRLDWLSRNLITTADSIGGCWGATYCGQCTAMSGWFVTMMTGYLYNIGDGIKVVPRMLLKNPDLSVSNTPTPFSVFSERGSTSAGHTGIVLGDLGNDTYLTIENNQGNHSIKIRTRQLSSFTNSNAKFLDLSQKLKLEHLGVSYD